MPFGEIAMEKITSLIIEPLRQQSAQLRQSELFEQFERPNSSFAFWLYRGLAALIDNTVIGAQQMAMLMIGMCGLFTFIHWTALPTKPSALCFFLVFLGIAQLLSVLYHALQEYSRYQSTIGLRQFGFIVLCNSGRKLSLTKSIQRNLWRLIVSPASALLLLLTMDMVVSRLFPTVSLSSPQIVIGEVLISLSIVESLVCKVRTGVPADWASTTIPVIAGSSSELTIQTERGRVRTRAYFGNSRRHAVVAIGGCGSGFGSPARGLYARIGQSLQNDGITTLWLRVRKPAELEDAVYDVRAAVKYLTSKGFSNIVLIGHSFGGAAVVSAAAFEPKVSGLILVASQNACTELVDQMAPRPVLIIHGKNDRVIPQHFAQDMFNRALSPKEIRYFADGHCLRRTSEAVFECVSIWLGKHFGDVSAPT